MLLFVLAIQKKNYWTTETYVRLDNVAYIFIASSLRGLFSHTNVMHENFDKSHSIYHFIQWLIKIALMMKLQDQS